MDIHYFRSPTAFRAWLAKNHATTNELWVGFYKVGTGKASINWPESVLEALCVGWIDGIRKSVDNDSYAIRFTPRRPGSPWSEKNIRSVKLLKKEGRMTAEGLRAFERRKKEKSGVFSYEHRSVELPANYAKIMKQEPAAWEYFTKQTPSYRKTVVWWVVSAKKEETRLSRLHQLIDLCAKGRSIRELAKKKPTLGA